MRYRQPPLRRTPLQFESLESRLPLAGNVAVQVRGLDLIITGDNSENAIDISLGLDGNGVPAWIIEGVNDVSGNDTTVNGQTQFAAKIPAGDFRNVTINLKNGLTPGNFKGIDTVNMTGVTMRGNLKIQGGTGGHVSLHDVEAVGSVDVKFKDGQTPANFGTFVEIIDCHIGCAGKNLTVATGNDDDSLEVRNTVIGGNLIVSTKNGDSTVDIGDSLIVKKATLTGGNDVDEVVIVDSVVGADLSIDGKNGDNTVALLGTRAGDGGVTSSTLIGGKVTVKGGNGQDALGFLGVVIEKNLSITLKNGENFAGAADLLVLGTTTISTGNDNDIIAIGLYDGIGGQIPPGAFGNVLVGNVTIKTGNGDDIVAASDTTFGAINPINGKPIGGNININLGGGDDLLAEIDNTFVGQPDPFRAFRRSRGGSGDDTIFSALDPDDLQLRFLQFENKNPPGGEALLFDAIFDKVDQHFRDILLSYGIDIDGVII